MMMTREGQVHRGEVTASSTRRKLLLDVLWFRFVGCRLPRACIVWAVPRVEISCNVNTPFH